MLTAMPTTDAGNSSEVSFTQPQTRKAEGLVARPPVPYFTLSRFHSEIYQRFFFFAGREPFASQEASAPFVSVLNSCIPRLAVRRMSTLFRNFRHSQSPTWKASTERSPWKHSRGIPSQEGDFIACDEHHAIKGRRRGSRLSISAPLRRAWSAVRMSRRSGSMLKSLGAWIPG